MGYSEVDSMTYSDTTVIIPTLNEVETLSSVVQGVHNVCPEIRILIVDDGSTDGTRELVLKLAAPDPANGISISLLDRSANPCKGLTASVVDGIKATVTPLFVVMDGDLQHPPELLPHLISRLREGGDLAIGVRENGTGDLALHRACISAFGNMLARICLVFGENTTRDPLSGLFAASIRVKSVVSSHSKTFELQGYKVLFDILRSAPMKLSIFEVPFRFLARRSGNSKFSLAHIWCFIRSVGSAVSCGLLYSEK